MKSWSCYVTSMERSGNSSFPLFRLIVKSLGFYTDQLQTSSRQRSTSIWAVLTILQLLLFGQLLSDRAYSRSARFHFRWSFSLWSFQDSSFSCPKESVPGGYIPRLESKEWECWKFLDWRLNEENDSQLHGQPSFLSLSFCWPIMAYGSLDLSLCRVSGPSTARN